MNAQRLQTTQEEQCMTGQVQLTEAIILASHASEKIIGLATKNLTKILANLLKRPLLRISAACNEFHSKLQIPQCGMKFYMP